MVLMSPSSPPGLDADVFLMTDGLHVCVCVCARQSRHHGDSRMTERDDGPTQKENKDFYLLPRRIFHLPVGSSDKPTCVEHVSVKRDAFRAAQSEKKPKSRLCDSVPKVPEPKQLSPPAAGAQFVAPLAPCAGLGGASILSQPGRSLYPSLGGASIPAWAEPPSQSLLSSLKTNEE